VSLSLSHSLDWRLLNQNETKNKRQIFESKEN